MCCITQSSAIACNPNLQQLHHCRCCNLLVQGEDDLQRLNLDYNCIPDLSVLSSLTSLTHLHASHNPLQTTLGLATLTGLHVLALGANQISTINELQVSLSLSPRQVWLVLLLLHAAAFHTQHATVQLRPLHGHTPCNLEVIMSRRDAHLPGPSCGVTWHSINPIMVSAVKHEHSPSDMTS